MSTTTTTATDDIAGSNLTCRLVGAAFVARKEQVQQDLFSQAEEAVEREDAFAFRFSPDRPVAEMVTAFIQEERECCPFLTFTVRYEPDGGPLWLEMGGSPAAKRFLVMELGIAT